MTYKVDETGEYTPIDIDEEVDKSGAALVIRSGGGRAGESFTVDEERMSIGRTPDAAVFLDDVTVSRNHALLVHRQDGYYIDDLGLAQRHLRQPAPDRVAPARRRRRDPDRQVQAQLPGEVRGIGMAVMAGKAGERTAAATDGRAARRRRLAPAQGADDRRRREDPRPGVRRHLDLQDPLPRGPEAARAAAHRRRLPPLQPGRRRAPARDPAHAARRVPAPAGDPPGARHGRLHRPAAERRGPEAPRRLGRRGRSPAFSRDELLAEAGVGEQFLRELQEFGIVAAEAPRRARGLRRDRPRDRPRRRRAVQVRRRRAQPARLPTSADREAALLEQLLGAQLRSRSQARRKEAVENLESLAAVCGHLKHLLLVRDLRRLKSAAE